MSASQSCHSERSGSAVKNLGFGSELEIFHYRDTVYESFFQEEIVQIVLESRRLKLLIFDEIQEIIIQWIPELR